MRIAFDVSPLSHPQTGVGTYIRGSLEGLVATAAGRHEVVAFAPASLAGRRAITASITGLPVARRLPVLPFAQFWRRAWSRLGRPAAERLVGAFDVLHFWDWMYPPQRRGLRSTMIHDLVPLHFPQWVTPGTREMHTAKYRHAAAACDLVFVNGRFTAEDVVEGLGVPPARVRVAHPGVEPIFTSDGPAADLGRPYILSVSTLEPRKNLGTLLAAHRLLDHELALAVVGPEGWGETEGPAGRDVLRLGYVPRARLPELYRGAAAFVYPSRFEGFGIPVVEAMACGAPCVVSSHRSLDEACGDAALRVDPESPEAVADGIETVLARRAELAAAGREHAAKFPWHGTGAAFLAGFEELV